MEQGRFARYLFLIVAVVAVVGLLNSGFLEATGFAAKAVAPKKMPACAAAEKALATAQKACKSAENAAKAAPKKCEDAKRAYGLAQVSYAKTPSAKTNGLMNRKKNAMDTACAAVEKTKNDQDTKCANAARAADNAKIVCAPPAPVAQPAAPAPAPAPAAEAQAAPEQQAAAQAQDAPAPQPAPAEQAAADPECTDSDLNPDNHRRPDITSFTINYSVAGIVHSVGDQGMAPLDYADRCESPTMLKEYYCSRTQGGGTWATEANYDCASEGKVCQNGACVVLLAVGAHCDSNPQCASDQCINNACA